MNILAIITVAGSVGNCTFEDRNGTTVLAVSIADRRWNYKTREEETVWVRAVWFGERAEKLAGSITRAKVLSITGVEAYKIYKNQIDRTIEPLDHSILAFQPKESERQAAGHGNRNVNNNRNINHYGYEIPHDDDLPF